MARSHAAMHLISMALGMASGRWVAALRMLDLLGKQRLSAYSHENSHCRSWTNCAHLIFTHSWSNFQSTLGANQERPNRTLSERGLQTFGKRLRIPPRRSVPR